MANNRNGQAALEQLDAAVRKFAAKASERSAISTADDAAMSSIRSLAAVASLAEDAAWCDALRRIDRADNPVSPRPVRVLADRVAAWTALSCEMATVGSTKVFAIRFEEHRTRVVSESVPVLELIAECLKLAAQRRAKDELWQQRRIDFVDELYSREETRALMQSFDLLESKMAQDFDSDIGHLRSARSSITDALRRVILWSRDRERPFIFSNGLPSDFYKPLHDWETMRNEWRAAKSRRKNVA